MRIALLAPATLSLLGALTLAVACGDDDPTTPDGSAGEGGSGGSGTPGTGGSKINIGGANDVGGAGGAPVVTVDVCAELGGAENINEVVRGDGKVKAGDPFNGFKFGAGRDGSVLLNAATDPCISPQFAHLLDPAMATELEHFAQCLSLFMQSTAGCPGIVYDGSEDSEGAVCKDMKSAHMGLGITEDDYTALILAAGKSLTAAGVTAASPAYGPVVSALTSDELIADIVTDPADGFSNPEAGGMCEGAGGADGTGGAGGAGL